MLAMGNSGAPDPWVVHIKAGTYDSDPDKSASEREIFPIELRNAITIQGDDGAENCIISGAFNPDSQVALLRGENLFNLLIKNLTLKNMNRTGGTGNGGGCELISCSGSVEGCIFQNNETYLSGTAGGQGGGLWLSIPENLRFNIYNNIFEGNIVSGYYPAGGGIGISTDFNGNIVGNTFDNNSGASHGGGFCISGNLTGNVSNNTFIGNSANYKKMYNAASSSGGGFHVSGNLTGNVSNNTFRGNSANCRGGGFCVGNGLTGNIFNNTFSSNSAVSTGGGFNISGILTGSIFSNTFSNDFVVPNSLSVYYHASGGGFYLGNVSDNLALISNNFFLYNSTSGNSKFGSGICSNQNVSIINNTFYGGNTDESCVGISNNAPLSILKNNIFANMHTAIWEEGELDLTITDNDFSNLTDILNRNNQPLGNDSFFIEMLLSGFSNNHDWAPGIVGEDKDTGAWTNGPVYDAANNLTMLTDSSKSWTADQWKGAMVNLSNSPATREHYPIIGNTATQIKIMGNLAVSALGTVGNIYSIDDYRLTEGSQNIDSGVAAGVIEDFEGEYRPQGTGIDIGADEFFTGGIIPSIAQTEPAASAVTSSVATLHAMVNPNNLTTTCYFEYGTTTGYGSTTPLIDAGSGPGLLSVSANISGLTPGTGYHFRVVATNDTGTATGPDHTFTTLPITAVITGRISLTIDVGIPNATITLNGTGYTAQTDSSGNFTMKNIPAGTYTMVVTGQDLLTKTYEVTLTESETLTLESVQMEVEGGITEAELEQAIQQAILDERSRWDVNGDNKKGLEEAIDALRVVTGIAVP